MISDNFTRADAPDLGAAWDQSDGGSIGIVSNNARIGAQSVSGYARHLTGVGSPDMYVEMVVEQLFGHYSEVEVVARYQPDAITYYLGRIIYRSTSGNTFHEIVKLVNGAEVDSITTETVYTRVLPDTVRLDVETVGGNVQLALSIDGVEVASGSDTVDPILTGDFAGFKMFTSQATTGNWPRLSLFTADQLNPPVAPDVPANFAGVTAPGQVDLSWDASAGAESYEIQREQWFGTEAP